MNTSLVVGALKKALEDDVLHRGLFTTPTMAHSMPAWSTSIYWSGAVQC